MATSYTRLRHDVLKRAGGTVVSLRDEPAGYAVVPHSSPLVTGSVGGWTQQMSISEMSFSCKSLQTQEPLSAVMVLKDSVAMLAAVAL